MEKVQTTYSKIINCGGRVSSIAITTSEGAVIDHISIHDGGEPCSGILRHWGTPENLISELEECIKAIKEVINKRK